MCPLAWRSACWGLQRRYCNIVLRGACTRRNGLHHTVRHTTQPSPTPPSPLPLCRLAGTCHALASARRRPRGVRALVHQNAGLPERGHRLRPNWRVLSAPAPATSASSCAPTSPARFALRAGPRHLCQTANFLDPLGCTLIAIPFPDKPQLSENACPVPGGLIISSVQSSSLAIERPICLHRCTFPANILKNAASRDLSGDKRGV